MREVAEKRCEELEERQQIKDEKEQMKKNESTFNELEELDKKIIELKEILKDLTIEKKKKDDVSEKCQGETQQQLNENYALLNNLSKDDSTKDLLSDRSINLDFNVSDTLNLNKEKGEVNISKKCDTKDPKHFINIDKNDISKKCYGCDVNKLKDSYSYIYNSFK